MFGPCTFIVVMNVLHLILLSSDFLFGFTMSVSQTHLCSCWLSTNPISSLLFLYEESSVSILGLSQPHYPEQTTCLSESLCDGYSLLSVWLNLESPGRHTCLGMSIEEFPESFKLNSGAIMPWGGILEWTKRETGRKWAMHQHSSLWVLSVDTM